VNAHRSGRTSAIKPIVAAAVLAAGWFSAAPTLAQSPEDFYRGKQLIFVIPVAAGGDYDLWARMIIRHLGGHIAGKPNVLPQNMPGGGQMTAANHLFNVAQRDGSVIGMIGRNLPNQALFKQPNVQFDPVKFNWIGSPELTNRVCGAMASSGIAKGEDLFDKELLMGGAGANTAVSTTPLLLHNVLGMKFKLIEGYGSTNAIMLAMERGEVQGICQTYMGIKNGNEDWLISGRFRILFNLERTAIAGLDVPTIYKFTKTQEQRDLIGLFNSSVELGRPVAAPPGVPADRVAALRRAFDATMKDPAFLAEAAQQKLEVNTLTGEQLDELVVALMKTPPEITAKMESVTRR
jgi:tripartite-type tricarboxylate transporter receptor subunit TctC